MRKKKARLSLNMLKPPKTAGHATARMARRTITFLPFRFLFCASSAIQDTGHLQVPRNWKAKGRFIRGVRIAIPRYMARTFPLQAAGEGLSNRGRDEEITIHTFY